MKKNGWGLGAMLGICAIMAAGLLLAVYLYNRFNFNSWIPVDDKNSTVSYSELEKTTLQAFKKYVSDHYDTGSDDIYVKVNEMKDAAYLGELVDGKGTTCIGYGKYNGKFHSYKAYLHCGDDYSTTGYDVTYE